MPLALLCTAQFIVVLDVTIVAVALPAIRADLGMDAATLQWVVTAYTLTFGGLLVTAGRAADVLGRRRMLMAGLALFAGASLACGLARSAGVLIAARAVQGTGAALVAPSALALLSIAYSEGSERGRAVGFWTAAAAGGGASGWVLGGVLADGAGWPWVFLPNVPIAAAAITLAPLLLRESRDRRSGGLDVPGALALTGALALLVLGLTRKDLAAIAGALLLGALFAAIERRAPRPLLPLDALRIPRFTGAGAVALALTATTTPPMFLVILYQRDELGHDALQTGLGCAPFNLAVIAGSLLGPRLAERRAMAGGLAAVAAGALGLAGAVAAGGGMSALVPLLVLMGAGLGAAATASTAAGTAALPADDQGIASGVLNAAAQVGTAIGLAVLVTIAAAYGHAVADLAAAALALCAAAVPLTSRRWTATRST